MAGVPTDIRAAIEQGPLGAKAIVVVGDHDYQAGELIRLFPDGSSELADNLTEGGGAGGIVLATGLDRFWFVSSAGELIPWGGHGLTGDANGYLWTGEDGGVVAADPSGPGVKVVQVALQVFGPNHVIFLPAQWYG